MKNIIFLDIDGVLNTKKTCVSAPSGNVGIDEMRVAILFLKSIQKYTDNNGDYRKVK